MKNTDETEGMTRLEWDSQSGRMRVGEHELHCGDCFELKVGGGWRPVRIEMAVGSVWVLVGLTGDYRALRFQGSEARL